MSDRYTASLSASDVWMIKKAPSADSGCKEEMTLEGSIGKV